VLDRARGALSGQDIRPRFGTFIAPRGVTCQMLGTKGAAKEGGLGPARDHQRRHSQVVLMIRGGAPARGSFAMWSPTAVLANAIRLCGSDVTLVLGRPQTPAWMSRDIAHAVSPTFSRDLASASSGLTGWFTILTECSGASSRHGQSFLVRIPRQSAAEF
jgi:hypothetical protein